MLADTRSSSSVVVAVATSRAVASDDDDDDAPAANDNTTPSSGKLRSAPGYQITKRPPSAVDRPLSAVNNNASNSFSFIARRTVRAPAPAAGAGHP